MNTVFNITDKLKIKSLEARLERMRFELDTHITNSFNVKSENFSLMLQIDRLKEENEELKKLLKSLEVDVVYG